MTVGPYLQLTATANRDVSTKYLQIFDTSTNYLVTCRTGTTCSVMANAGAPDSFVATIADSETAYYSPTGKLAISDVLTPPARTLTLTQSTAADGTKTLTAETNYAVGGSNYLQIFNKTQGNQSASCRTGTTCTLPQGTGNGYTYIATIGPENAYFTTTGQVAVSAPFIPPPWAVSISVSGRLATATSNYKVQELDFYDLTNGGYMNGCSGGVTTCVAYLPTNGDQVVAVNGSFNMTFPPGTLYAVSSPVAYAGPGSPHETNAGSNPAELNQCFTCRSDPINTLTGEFFENVTDNSTPGRGPALETKRAYSSQGSRVDSPFGYGWAFNYAMNLVPAASGATVDVHQENGSMVTFTNSAGIYTAPSRVLAGLTRNADGSWTYTRRSKEIFDFDSTGLLTRIRDLNGNAVTLSRDTAGHIITATDGSGRALTFAYDGSGHITAATDPAGHTTNYGYDASGRLTSVTTPAQAVTSYGYDTAYRLSSVTDPNGKTTTNVYDAGNRVTKQTDRNGVVTTFAYGADRTTTTTSPAGRVTKETYTNGVLATVVKGAGTPQAATWTYTYDPATLGTTKVTDPLNHVTTATYDANGNKLTSTDPNGHTTTITYDNLNDPTSVTDPAGTVTTLTYDTSGNPLTRSTPLTGTSQTSTTTYTHGDTNHPGDVTAVTDPDGHTTDYAYDASGNRTSTTDPGGNTARATFDPVGKILTTTSARGNTTSYAYDADGRPVTVTDPLNNTTSYGYDADGNRTTVTDAQNHTTTTAYDPNGHVISQTSPDGSVTTTANDPDGNPTTVTDPAGHATTYAYDPLGRILSATDPLNRATTYGYDAAGHVTSITDASGRTTSNTYDLAGDKTGTSYSDGTTPAATFTYTATGLQATMQDGTGTTTKSYDSLGRLTSSTNGAGQASGYTYDLAGHLTALAYPNGRTATRAYDTAGHLTGITDWLGHTTAFTPDADGNTTSTIYGNGVTAATTFDAVGQVAAIADTGPGSTALASFTYTRNNTGALASTTTTGITQPAESYSYTSRDQLAAVNTNPYTYDPAGNATALGSGANLAHDAASQPTGYTLAGTTTTISYDAQGNRLTGPASGGSTAAYSWDQANRLTGASGTSFAYNAEGLRTSRVPATGPVQHYAWDTRAGVPLMLTDGTTSYLYDDAGNPVEHIDPTGTALYYQHDQYGSTRLLTDSNGTTAATYIYDANGNLTNKSGTADTPLRWNGQAQDTDTGLYYLRARYYDPMTAQFLSVDPLAAITNAIYAYANNNPLNASDRMGLWSWNPFEWSRQEWDTVGAVAGVIALAATIATVTVATGGTAALVLGVVATSATVVNAGITGTEAGFDCVGGRTADCLTGILNTGLSLFGFRAGGILRGTAWTARHVAASARSEARLIWGAANFAGPSNDALNYYRNYCQ